MRYFIVFYYLEDSRHGDEALSILIESEKFPSRESFDRYHTVECRVGQYLKGITGITELSKEDAMIFYDWNESDFSKLVVKLN